MDVKVNVGQLVHAIASDEIKQFACQVTAELRQQTQTLLEQFTAEAPTPSRTLDLENTLQDQLREFGRKAIQWLASRLEPDLEKMPGTITHQDKSHRRLMKQMGQT